MSGLESGTRGGRSVLHSTRGLKCGCTRPEERGDPRGRCERVSGRHFHGSGREGRKREGWRPVFSEVLQQRPGHRGSQTEVGTRGCLVAVYTSGRVACGVDTDDGAKNHPCSRRGADRRRWSVDDSVPGLRKGEGGGCRSQQRTGEVLQRPYSGGREVGCERGSVTGQRLVGPVPTRDHRNGVGQVCHVRLPRGLRRESRSDG